MAVHFTGLVPAALKERTALKNYIKKMILDSDLVPGNLTISFCNDEQIHEANKLYLSHDYYTDILTFDLSENGSKILNADILISADTVKTNSIKFQTSFLIEMHRVVFHGILHLCGYKDKNPSEVKSMRKAEDLHLATYLNN